MPDPDPGREEVQDDVEGPDVVQWRVRVEHEDTALLHPDKPLDCHNGGHCGEAGHKCERPRRQSRAERPGRAGCNQRYREQE